MSPKGIQIVNRRMHLVPFTKMKQFGIQVAYRTQITAIKMLNQTHLVFKDVFATS